MKKVAVNILVCVGVALMLAACADQPHPVAGADLPGFWSGLWHGLTVPFSIIGELFSDVRIYNFPNNGGWYDFGFFIGLGGLSGIGVFHDSGD
jgi:hypothetical protein